MTHAIETVDYKDFTIRIVYDLDPSNPWKDGEGEPPLVSCHTNYGRDDVRGYGLDLKLPEIPAEILTKHYKVMLTDLGYADTWCGLLKFAREDYVHARGRHYLYESLEEALCARWNEYLQDESVSDRMEKLAMVYGWMGVSALKSSVTGFSQGDYADVLIVITKAWRELVGLPTEMQTQCMEQACKLYEDWVFGSVYGYQIVDKDGDEVHSCYGYYGFDHEASGLLQSARQVIDVEADRRLKEALKQAPFRQRAMDTYLSDDVQIYPDSSVDIVDDGAWVSASVWIPNEAD